MQILGVANSYASAPVNAPTSLSAVPSTTSAAISFTAPTNDGGAAITNYEYSFNNSTWTALSPADAVSPVTISGLTANTAYTIYLRAVNIVGSGPASTVLAVTTNPIFMSASGGSTQDVTVGAQTFRVHTFTGSGTFTVSTVGSFGTVEYLVVGGGGGGGTGPGGGGGGGGFRTNVAGQTSGRNSSAEAAMSVSATSYGVTVGGGGARGNNLGGNTFPTNGGNSSFNGITSLGGGAGGFYWFTNGNAGGSGGGGTSGTGGAGTTNQGGDGRSGSGYRCGGGGAPGSAGAISSGNGAPGLSSTIRGSAGTITIAGGGGGGNYYATPGTGGTGGGGNGDGYSGKAGDGSQYGAGGGGGFVNAGYPDRGGGTGAQGVVYIRYRIA